MKENNPTVMLTLDRPRELRFGHRAMKRWAAYTGKSVAELETTVTNPVDAEILLFFMLEQDAAAHNEALDMGQMEDLLDMAPLGVIYEKLSEAVNAAFPDAGEAAKAHRAGTAEKNVGRAEAGTGKNA